MASQSGTPNELEYHMYSQLKSGRWDRRRFLQQAVAVGLGVPMIGSVMDAALPGGVAAAATIHRGGTGVIGTNVPTLLPDPATVLDQGGIVATQIAGEYLMVPDIHWNLQPSLASAYKMKNASTHVFTIRSGVKFHNGQTLTAADVVQTFRSLVASGSAASSTYAGILKAGGVVATGPMEVTFNLEVPWVGFAYLCSPFAYQAIILPANYKSGSFMSTPQGTGAYMVKSYTPGVGATYVANPNYWNSAKAGPYMDGVNLVFYSDTSAGVLAMAAGSYDYMPAVSYGTGQELFYTKGVSIQSHASTSYRSVQMRVDKGQPLANVHKRLAIASCLDRKGMVASLLGGYGSVANDSYMAPAFPTSALAIKDLPQRSQNIRQAKKHLAMAGMSRGFKVTLTTESVYEIPLLAQTIKANCAQAGIDINLKVIDQNDYYNEWTSVPMGITDWSARGIPAQGLQYYTAGNSWNTAHWADKKFGAELKALNSASSPAEAKQAGLGIAREMYNQVPVCIPYWIDDTQAYASGVTIGYAPSTLVNVTNMHLPAGHK